jgi:hypothetical protein
VKFISLFSVRGCWTVGLVFGGARWDGGGGGGSDGSGGMVGVMGVVEWSGGVVGVVGVGDRESLRYPARCVRAE